LARRGSARDERHDDEVRPVEILLLLLSAPFSRLGPNHVCNVGNGFKDLAKRAHSSLVRMDPDSAALKIGAHIAMWGTATKLV